MQKNTAGRFRKGQELQSEGNARQCSSSTSIVGTVSAIVGAAAVGAVAMYLMDPNHGAERRTRTINAAGRALETASDAARTAYAGASHLASDAYASAKEKVSQGMSNAQDAMPSGRSLRRMGKRISNGASDALSGASDTGSHMLASARDWLPRGMRSERHSDYAMEPLAVSATAFSTLVIGAAAMWVFDPDRGRARRAWLAQKATRVVNEMSKFARATGRHLSNKSRGYYAKGRSAIGQVSCPPDSSNEFETLDRNLHGVSRNA